MPLFLILLFPLIISCTSLQDSTSYQAAFKAPYSLVWQAVLLAMQSYPIQKEDLEGGILTTKTIRRYSVWTPPPKSIKHINNRHYKIKIFLEKGRENSVKLHIIKNEFMDKDFIQHSIPVASNGLEESVIAYRIQREILLEKKLKAFHKEKKERAGEPEE